MCLQTLLQRQFMNGLLLVSHCAWYKHFWYGLGLIWLLLVIYYARLLNYGLIGGPARPRPIIRFDQSPSYYVTVESRRKTSPTHSGIYNLVKLVKTYQWICAQLKQAFERWVITYIFSAERDPKIEILSQIITYDPLKLCLCYGKTKEVVKTLTLN